MHVKSQCLALAWRRCSFLSSCQYSRYVLHLVCTLAAAAALSACASKPGSWPSRALPPSAAVKVDAAQFLPKKQLVDWQVDLEDRRLRATGSARHEAYIDALHERLTRAGVKQLRFEPVSFRQWSVQMEKWGHPSGGWRLA